MGAHLKINILDKFLNTFISFLNKAYIIKKFRKDYSSASIATSFKQKI